MDLARLDKLHDMMKKGVITKKEFDAEKAKLILDDAGDTTPLDRLEKLNDLLKSGAISRAEFNQQKKRLMENYGDDAPVITKRRASVVRPDNLFDVHGRDAGKLYRDTRTLGESVSAVGALFMVLAFFMMAGFIGQEFVLLHVFGFFVGLAVLIYDFVFLNKLVAPRELPLVAQLVFACVCCVVPFIGIPVGISIWLTSREGFLYDDYCKYQKGHGEKVVGGVVSLWQLVVNIISWVLYVITLVIFLIWQTMV